MKYSRLALLAACETVRPALAAKDLIEALSHVWFDGTTITAYNDADLGIQVPFKTPFKGGLRGALLLGLLGASAAKEVEFGAIEGGNMKVTAGRSVAKMAVLDIGDAVWEFPEPNMKNTFEVDSDFLAALELVLVGVGNDTAMPERLGVTLVADKGAVFYSTDNKTASTARASAPKGAWMRKGDRVIMPTAFCQQLLRVCKGGGFMEVRKDCVIAGNADAVHVYARLVDVTKPLDFAGTIKEHTSGAKVLELPSKLEGALDRALVVLDGAAATVGMIATGNKLRVEAVTEGRASLKDFMDMPGVNEIELQVDPALLKRAIPFASKVSLGERAVVLYGERDFVYLTSTGGA